MVDMIQMSGSDDEKLEPLSEDVQVPVGMELMCLLHHDDPATWAHSDAVMHFYHGDSPHKIRGRDIIPHVERQLRQKREFLRGDVEAGRPAFVETQVEDSLDDWTIRYELNADGSVSKLYINFDTLGDSFVVALDEKGEMRFPERVDGKEFMLLGGDDALVEALRVQIAKVLRGQDS